MPPTSTSGCVERTWPSVRRRSGVVKTSSVGRFGDVELPPRGLVARGHPARLLEHPDGQIGAGAAEAAPRRNHARSAALRAPGARRCARARLRPGRARRGGRSRGSPPRAARRRARRRPAPPSRASGRRRSSRASRRGRTACQYAWRSSGITERATRARVEAGEEVRVGLADDVHERCLALGLLLDLLERPRRRPGDRLVGRELRPRAAQVRVEVARVDTPRALVVGDAGDRPRRAARARHSDDTMTSWPFSRLTPTRSASRAYSSSSLSRACQNASTSIGLHATSA